MSNINIHETSTLRQAAEAIAKESGSGDGLANYKGVTIPFSRNTGIPQAEQLISGTLARHEAENNPQPVAEAPQAPVNDPPAGDDSATATNEGGDAPSGADAGQEAEAPAGAESSEGGETGAPEGDDAATPEKPEEQAAPQGDAPTAR